MIEYEFIDDKVIATTKYGNMFQFDKEDYEKIKNYNWRVDSDCGVFTVINGKRISFPKILFESDSSYTYLDGNKFNYCKDNLYKITRTNKLMDYNGYNSIYFPEHHRAFKNGMVYEHILKAEELLGRKLLDEEVVHHIDKNRKNNSLDNLMVFKTDSDHIAYHQGCEAIKDDGVWYCPEIGIHLSNKIIKSKTKNNVHKYYKLCPECGKEISKKSKYCRKCAPKFIEHKHNVEWPTKEELKELILKKPFTQIAKMFGVTDNAVRKWCKHYGLPFRKKDIELQIV